MTHEAIVNKFTNYSKKINHTNEKKKSVKIINSPRCVQKIKKPHGY